MLYNVVKDLLTNRNFMIEESKLLICGIISETLIFC